MYYDTVIKQIFSSDSLECLVWTLFCKNKLCCIFNWINMVEMLCCLDGSREGRRTGSAYSLLFFPSVSCVYIHWFAGSIQAAVKKKKRSRNMEWSGAGGKSSDYILNNSNQSDWFSHCMKPHPKTLLKKKIPPLCWFVIVFYYYYCFLICSHVLYVLRTWFVEVLHVGITPGQEPKPSLIFLKYSDDFWVLY